MESIQGVEHIVTAPGRCLHGVMHPQETRQALSTLLGRHRRQRGVPLLPLSLPSEQDTGGGLRTLGVQLSSPIASAMPVNTDAFGHHRIRTSRVQGG